MMNQMMFFMPIMFAWITLGLPSGLTLYWTVSNILALVQQYFVTGWGALGRLVPVPAGKGAAARAGRRRARARAAAAASTAGADGKPASAGSSSADAAVRTVGRNA